MAKIENISMRLVSGVGFSNGCALLALKKPPPFVPNSLMISCEATGPWAMVCSVTVSMTGLPWASDHRLAVRTDLLHLLWLDQFRRVVRVQVLDNALRNKDQRAHDAERQQHPQATANQVDPEIADGLHSAGGRCRE